MTKISQFVTDAPKVPGISFPVYDPNEVSPADQNKRMLLDNLTKAIEVASYAAAETLINDELLVAGQFYKINNLPAAGDSIVLPSVAANAYDMNGWGIFKVPDFQGVGDYSGVNGLTGVAYTNLIGVWTASAEGTYVTGDVVIWNGFHYQLIAAGSVDGNDPYTNTTAYQLLPKSTANVGYITEIDIVVYNFGTQTLQYRRDKRNNVVEQNIYPGVSHQYSFQWGNDNVNNNRVSFPGAVNMANFRGYFYNNVVQRGTVTLRNGNTGEIHSNVFSMIGFDFLNEAGDFTTNMILCNQQFSEIPISENFSNCFKDKDKSTFNMDIDMDVSFDTGTLNSISAGVARLIGRYRMINADASTVTNMHSDYLACSHPIEFIVESGNTQTFSPSAIGGTPAFYSLIGPSGDVTLTGRANGWDSILIRGNNSYFEIYQKNIIA